MWVSVRLERTKIVSRYRAAPGVTNYSVAYILFVGSAVYRFDMQIRFIEAII
jgi:hypothetical protein